MLGRFPPSPAVAVNVLLGSLSVAQLKETFGRTVNAYGERLPEVIKFGCESIREAFFQRLEEETAGYPRFAHKY